MFVRIGLRPLAGICLAVTLLPVWQCVEGAEAPFIRGDANADGHVDIGDAVFILGYTFRGTRAPPCLDAADVNDDGRTDISDAIYLLGFLFRGSARPPEPYPAAGFDTTPDSLVCPASTDEEATVLRSGRFEPVAYTVTGDAEHLDDGTIRLRNFNYDGGGLPGVVVWLHGDLTLGSQRGGIRISDDLYGTEFVDATLVFPIPPEVTGDSFGYVSIWCEPGAINYAYARLFR